MRATMKVSRVECLTLDRARPGEKGQLVQEQLPVRIVDLVPASADHAIVPSGTFSLWITDPQEWARYAVGVRCVVEVNPVEA